MVSFCYYINVLLIYARDAPNCMPQTSATQRPLVTYTALITPFTKNGENGEIDIDALLNLANLQAKAGIDGVVFAGTTGEGYSMGNCEYKQAIRAIRAGFPRLNLIAGVSGLATSRFARQARCAQEAGADQVMIGMPSYCKPPQAGLEEHIVAVANHTDLPAIIYNVPTRTGVDLEPETTRRALARAKNIIAIKEASPSMNRIEIYHNMGLTFLLGNDSGMQGGMVLGADGIVSVASNIVPAKVISIIRNSRVHPTQTLLEYNHVANLVDMLSCEVNPLPVKYAASLMGLCEPNYRLPLCPPTENSQRRIRTTLQSYSLVRTEPVGAVTFAMAK